MDDSLLLRDKIDAEVSEFEVAFRNSCRSVLRAPFEALEMKNTSLFDLGGTLACYYEVSEFPGILRKGIGEVSWR